MLARDSIDSGAIWARDARTDGRSLVWDSRLRSHRSRRRSEVWKRDCKTEIVELHQFFQDWFNAAIPDGDESFARLDEALAGNFELIGPDGKAYANAKSLVAGLTLGLRTMERQAGPNLDREHATAAHRGGSDPCSATRSGKRWTAKTAVRLSTVLFGVEDRAPRGVAWLHLHEVWMQP